MPVDSHIVMPASIMRGFHIKKKTRETYSLDINSNKIESVVIKDHGSEYGYYDDNAESVLSSYETEFGTIKKYIYNVLKSSNSISLSQNDSIIVKKFLTMALSRNRTMSSKIQRSSFFCRLFNLQVDTSESIKNSDKIFSDGKLFDDYNISILKIDDNIDYNFVCPENCLFTVFLPSYIGRPVSSYLFFPIHPKIGICLSKNTILSFQNIADDIEKVKNINVCALFSVHDTQSKFLVAQEKKELEDLQLKNEEDAFKKKVYIFEIIKKGNELTIDELRLLPEYEKECLLHLAQNDIFSQETKKKIQQALNP